MNIREKLIQGKELRKKIKSNTLSFGTWMQIPHPSIAEILSRESYEWVALDLEHGAISTNDLPNLFRGIENNSKLPFVRLATPTRREIKSALDAGAMGLIIPMIESREGLMAAIDEMTYAPKGKRGVGFSRANDFGREFDHYYHSIDDSLSVIAQIESINAVNCLEDILQVDRVDAFLIGPYDLSASMGIPGQFENSEFLKAIEKFQSICIKHKKTMGFHQVKPDRDLLNQKIQSGYCFIAYGVDSAFLNLNCSLPNFTKE